MAGWDEAEGVAGCYVALWGSRSGMVVWCVVVMVALRSFALKSGASALLSRCTSSCRDQASWTQVESGEQKVESADLVTVAMPLIRETIAQNHGASDEWNARIPLPTVRARAAPMGDSISIYVGDQCA
ncbi:hypothetical protein CC78DRAFT_577102 [Lojkania enalia]|uniref:Uncharacterized protein n=1 Tax=Lojkania enalia TaxID=147567 RepID=A0A9P4N6E7_9PLEO|nr:hypothetical protein CC78DRAFT_577102 [Didymosphaeria enalia]